MTRKIKVREDLLPINPFTRPGKKLESIKGVVVHWTGNAGSDAVDNVKYFHHLSKQTDEDDARYASAHYFVGLSGDVIQTLPDDEVAYHVGARKYNGTILEKFDTTYPNNCLIGVEMCHSDWSGRFNVSTLESSVKLVASLLHKYDLTTDEVVRHYDVTGKDCPKYFVANEREYDRFLGDVDRKLRDMKRTNNRLGDKLKSLERRFHR